jgi:putative beta-lysine N-acetyltransferase
MTIGDGTMDRLATLVPDMCKAVDSKESASRDLTFHGVEGERQAIFDPHNERMKLYGLAPGDCTGPELWSLLNALTQHVQCISKVTVYARPKGRAVWRQNSFRHEGFIRGFFGDGADAHLWAYYTSSRRAVAAEERVHNEILALAQSKKTRSPSLPAGYTCRLASGKDAPAVASLLRETFPDYPTPIRTATIEKQIITRANLFRLVYDGDGELAAVASAEIDHVRKNAEMTDCATVPEHRGVGLMAFILKSLEDDLRTEFGIRDVYTLARAGEAGMNCVFSRLGYDYAGRLINNCRMPDGWESMNIWCKRTAGS